MDGERAQSDAVWDKLPPHDLGAERCVIASLVLGDIAVQAQIRGLLRGTDFYSSDHQTVFDAACGLLDAGAKLDGVQVRAELENRGLLSDIGGVSFLMSILEAVPTASHGRHYAEIVRDRSVKRLLIAHGGECIREGYAPSRLNDADELIARASRRLSDITVSGRSASFWSISSLLGNVVEQLEAGGAQLIPFGVDPIDAHTGGIGIGEMCIVGARPSMGKSTFLRQVMVSAARKGTPVGFISLEEGGLKIARNVLSAYCGIENQKLRKGQLVKEEWDGVMSGVADLGNLPILMSDSARRIRDIRALVMLWAVKHGVKLIILDYLQRVRGGLGTSEYEKVSAVSGELSDLWKEAGVAAVVAAQLNRGVESRGDKRPNMADLRSSGQIEQDADSIVFLHREDYYHMDDPNYTPNHTAEFIIAKWRDGARGGTVKMRSNLKYQRFVDMPEPEIQDPFA